MNIKVLFVSNHAGFSKFNAPYVDLLYRNGIEVIDAAPGNEVPLNAVHVDIPVARNPLSWGNLWAYVLLGRVVREENITHVHCHTPVGGLLGRLLKLVRPRLQVMYTAHGFHFFGVLRHGRGCSFFRSKRCSRHSRALLSPSIERISRWPSAVSRAGFGAFVAWALI